MRTGTVATRPGRSRFVSAAEQDPPWRYPGRTCWPRGWASRIVFLEVFFSSWARLHKQRTTGRRHRAGPQGLVNDHPVRPGRRRARDPPVADEDGEKCPGLAWCRGRQGDRAALLPRRHNTEERQMSYTPEEIAQGKEIGEWVQALAQKMSDAFDRLVARTERVELEDIMREAGVTQREIDAFRLVMAPVVH